MCVCWGGATFKIQSNEGHLQQGNRVKEEEEGGDSAEVSTGPAALLMQPWM